MAASKPTRAPVRAIIGLGNPGAEYAATLHNAGFWVLDALAREFRGEFRQERKFHGALARFAIAGVEVFALKPDTYMNRSGQAVQALAAYFKLAPSELLVVHDDLDLPPGTLRFKVGGGHGGHNGLRDTILCIGPDFRRLRVGIGHPGHRDAVLPYVLNRPGPGQAELLEDAVERSIAIMPVLLRDGWDKAAQLTNTRQRGQRSDGH